MAMAARMISSAVFLSRAVVVKPHRLTSGHRPFSAAAVSLYGAELREEKVGMQGVQGIQRKERRKICSSAKPNAVSETEMQIQLYNTMKRQKELFRPLVPGKVSMYVCGVTSYDYSHIGHARVYVAFDVLFR